MHLRHIAGAALLIAVGCGNKAKETSQAAAAKSAEEAKIDQRARAVAQDLIQSAAADADKKRELAKQQQADARRQLRESAVDHPDKFLLSDKLQTTDDGKRRLTSIAITNSSTFSMSDIHGTVDYHGDHGDVLARVPTQLTGAIAPGASMVFSEQQHTLSGTPIQLPKAPTTVTFTITSVKVGSEGIDSTSTPAVADGGIASGAP